MAPHTPPADDTGRTDVTFSDGYIPELIEDQRDRVALFDTRMADAMMQYAELRDGLRKLQDEFGPAIAAAHTECVEGECCVCLDELGPTIDVTRTTCGHVFHTKCLVETLADGTVTSCPMCRTDIRELAGKDMSGKAFRYMCLVRINADTVQSCTRTTKQEIEREVDKCESEARSCNKWSALSPGHRHRRSMLKSRLMHLRTRLQLLEQFSQANAEGFQDISKHISHVLGRTLGDATLLDCKTRLDCFRDSGVDGEYMRIAKRLSSVIEFIGVDRSVVELHEDKLRESRGLSAPSYSEAHFASAACGGSGDDEGAVSRGCFPSLSRRRHAPSALA